MREEEVTARQLASLLHAAALPAKVSGGRIQSQVEVGPVGPRSLLIECFWYERARSGLMLGMNRGNARSGLTSARAPYEGPEFLAMLSVDGKLVADGRTREVSAAIACARAWVGGMGLEALAHAVPFVDEQGRAMRAMTQTLDPRLRHELGGDPCYELQVSGEGRACRVRQVEGSTACSFMMGPAQQVARLAHTDEVGALTRVWLIERASLAELSRRAPGLELERHAEVLEVDPARWHWLHVRDRLEDADDVLAPLREVVWAFAASPIASRFFSFSSLNRFCFSASSHYPWVNEGLPVIAPDLDGKYAIADSGLSQRFDRHVELEAVVRRVEARLSAYPIAPFFGTEDDP